MWPGPSRGRFRLYALVLAPGAVFVFCLLILDGGCKTKYYALFFFCHLCLDNQYIYFYLKGDNSTTCDPWTSKNFTELMSDYMVKASQHQNMFPIKLPINHLIKQGAKLSTFQVSPECGAGKCLPECEATKALTRYPKIDLIR